MIDGRKWRMGKQRLLCVLILLVCSSTTLAQTKHKALIIDGQNNHKAWPKTTVMMKQYLEETGLFTVDVKRTKYTWKGGALVKQYPLPGVVTLDKPEPQADPTFAPKFSDYAVVISNFGWRAEPWPKKTQEAFVDYMRGGGGFVVVHAANNSFGDWPEFNRIIGLGGWGGRNEKSGPQVFYNEAGEEVRDTTPGKTGSHGREHEFQVVLRNAYHPIVKGMPRAWMHTKDELYDQLRGPAESMTVLATAFASKETGGSGRHEPMMMTVTYGKGRIFHTPMGHEDYSQECVGFIVALQRGAEWAATGKVTQEIPSDFPTRDQTSKRDFGS